jgi:hypothetical protein
MTMPMQTDHPEPIAYYAEVIYDGLWAMFVSNRSC